MEARISFGAVGPELVPAVKQRKWILAGAVQIGNEAFKLVMNFV
jgi:hypothetical protein